MSGFAQKWRGRPSPVSPRVTVATASRPHLARSLLHLARILASRYCIWRTRRGIFLSPCLLDYNPLTGYSTADWQWGDQAAVLVVRVASM